MAWVECSFVGTGWIEGCALPAVDRWYECGWLNPDPIWADGPPCEDHNPPHIPPVVTRGGGGGGGFGYEPTFRGASSYEIIKRPDTIAANNEIILLSAMAFMELGIWRRNH